MSFKKILTVILAALMLLLPVNAVALGAEIEIPGGALFQDDLKMVTDFTVDMKSCASLIGANFDPIDNFSMLFVGAPISFKVLHNQPVEPTVTLNGVPLTQDADGTYHGILQNQSVMLSVRFKGDEGLNNWDKDYYGRPLSVYNQSVYLQNIWSGNTVYQEAALFYTGRSTVKLLYPVSQMVSLRSYDLKTNYVQGVDYDITAAGELKLLPGSRIPVYSGGLTTTEKPASNAFPLKENPNEYLKFIKDSDFPRYAVSATYVHEKTFQNGFLPAAPASQQSKLQGVLQKLQAGQQVNLVVYGDSISCGWSSSGLNNREVLDKDNKTIKSNVINVAPYAPTWVEMLLAALKKQYPSAQINLKNLSLSGMGSAWGGQNIAARLATWKNKQGVQVQPDLVLVGFGVNDAAGNVTAEKFGQNILQIVQQARRQTGNKDLPFLLYSPMLPNQRVMAWDAETKLLPYQEQLQQIANNDPAIGVARITDIFKEIVKSKECVDYLNTNVNHGNDFTARIYATALLAALGVTTVPEKVGGDVNADGEINLKDVIILAEYALNNEKPLADENAADCDGSGKVDLKDAAYLAQHLAGWQNRTPHYNITKALQQDGYYEPLFQKAIANKGNRALLAKALQKAKALEAAGGGEFTLAGLGGSITQGAGANWGDPSTRYINKIGAWLQKQFPHVKINVVNAGIGATTSLLGKARMAEQVLSYNPDLVIVDFTINDQNEQRYAYSYEAIIRTLLQKQVATVGLLFGCVNQGKYNSNGPCVREQNRESMHLPILTYYNVPTINYYAAMWDYLDSNGDGQSNESDLAQWRTLWYDYIHPSIAGHTLSANAVNYYLQTVLNELSNIDTAVPALPAACLHSETNTYLGVTMYTKNNVGQKITGSSKVNYALYGNRDANTITNWNPWLIEKGGYLEFTLDALKCMTLMHVQGPGEMKDINGEANNNKTLSENSAVEVTVNGKKVLTDSVSATGAILNWASGTYICNEQGKVTVRITCTAGTYCLTSVLFGE